MDWSWSRRSSLRYASCAASISRSSAARARRSLLSSSSLSLCPSWASLSETTPSVLASVVSVWCSKSKCFTRCFSTVISRLWRSCTSCEQTQAGRAGGGFEGQGPIGSRALAVCQVARLRLMDAGGPALPTGQPAKLIAGRQPWRAARRLYAAGLGFPRTSHELVATAGRAVLRPRALPGGASPPNPPSSIQALCARASAAAHRRPGALQGRGRAARLHRAPNVLAAD